MSLGRLEKKSLVGFLSIYLGTVSIFLVFVSYFYYALEKEKIIDTFQRELQTKKSEAMRSIMGRSGNGKTTVGVILYDKDKIISSTADINITNPQTVGFLVQNNRVYMVSRTPPMIAADGWMVIEGGDFSGELAASGRKISAFFIFSLAFFGISGWFLSKLVLKPWSLSDRMIKNFIKDLTHELNTPITVLQSSLERLEGLCLDEKGAKIVKRATSGAKTIAMLYDDLVYLNFKDQRVDKAAIIDLSGVISNRIEFFAPLAERKKISITANLSPSQIKISPKEALRIVDNLLSNAIKYNKDGGKIDILLQEGRLAIEDTGVGMDQKLQNKIFDRQVRGESLLEGFGLGLAIVKEVCDRRGIKIKVQSKQDEGSKFALEWSGANV